MAIRERARALFKSRSKTDRDSQTSGSSKASTERWPSNVYKPGEPMPRPKYRAAPKKEHTEKLEAFTFAEAWRRKSFQSQYSPMGTRAPSRRNSAKTPGSRRSSWISLGRKSFSGPGADGRSNNNSISITSGETEPSSGGGSGMRPREGAMHMGAAVPTTLQTEPEAEGDDDVHNVGLSRVQSYTNPLTPTLGTAHDHQFFTEHDLALALRRSHLDGSHLAVPA